MSGAVQALIGSLRAGDPNWASVTLLLPGNGTNGAQNNTFIDSSANAFAITRNGNTTQGTFSPFTAAAPYSAASKGGSGYFDGNGDYLSVLEADVDETLWYSGQFTLEYWIYPLAFGGTSNNASYSNVIGWASPTTSGEGFDFGPNSSGLVITYYFNGAQQYQPSTTSIRLREWAHLAIVGNNGSMTMYVNGQNAGGAFTYSGTPQGGLNFLIGKITSGGNFNGYLNSIRVSTTRRYTTTFTPPTAPLTSDASTKLLLNFTNAGIIDNAMLNDLETVGNAQISTAQSKFGGSSILFNGTTGYLTAPTNTAFGFGTGDFTMECWVYTVGYGGTGSVLIDLRSGVEPSVKPDFEFTSAGVPVYRVNGATQITGSAVATGAWTHIALCRASGTTRMFVNGTQVGSSYADANNYGASSRLSIGVDDDGSPNAYFNGYIDDLRITKGVARYTANFTPPAAAFPTS